MGYPLDAHRILEEFLMSGIQNVVVVVFVLYILSNLQNTVSKSQITF